ncbi:MAG: rod shape-determining protein MreD [Acidimicrobiales bacterium]|nr:rod shape-determining protein MreD [Acidimicrobiales bacterium]
MNRLRVAIVLVTLLIVQITVFAHLRPAGVAPNMLVLATVMGGIVGGTDRGAWHGFFAGLLLDLVSPGPFGLAAGVYAALGYLVGVTAESFDSQDARVGPLVAALGSFLGVAGYGLGLGILGIEQYVSWGLVRVGIVVGLINAAMYLPMRIPYEWIVSELRTFASAERARNVVN